MDEVAAHLGVVRESVYRWVESRGLPARRVGRLLRFRLSQVDAWVEGRSAPASGDDSAHRDAEARRVAEPRAAYGTPEAAVGESVPEAIDEMVRILVDRFDPERIVLFGSHARGDVGPHSDVDLLVIMPFEGSKREKRLEIRLALHEVRVPKDIVLASPEEVERTGRLVGSLLHAALREGRTLYVRRGD